MTIGNEKTYPHHGAAPNSEHDSTNQNHSEEDDDTQESLQQLSNYRSLIENQLRSQKLLIQKFKQSKEKNAQLSKQNKLLQSQLHQMTHELQQLRLWKQNVQSKMSDMWNNLFQNESALQSPPNISSSNPDHHIQLLAAAPSNEPSIAPKQGTPSTALLQESTQRNGNDSPATRQVETSGIGREHRTPSQHVVHQAASPPSTSPPPLEQVPPSDSIVLESSPLPDWNNSSSSRVSPNRIGSSVRQQNVHEQNARVDTRKQSQKAHTRRSDATPSPSPTTRRAPALPSPPESVEQSDSDSDAEAQAMADEFSFSEEEEEPPQRSSFPTQRHSSPRKRKRITPVERREPGHQIEAIRDSSRPKRRRMIDMNYITPRHLNEPSVSFGRNLLSVENYIERLLTSFFDAYAHQSARITFRVELGEALNTIAHNLWNHTDAKYSLVVSCLFDMGRNLLKNNSAHLFLLVDVLCCMQRMQPESAPLLTELCGQHVKKVVFVDNDSSTSSTQNPFLELSFLSILSSQVEFQRLVPYLYILCCDFFSLKSDAAILCTIPSVYLLSPFYLEKNNVFGDAIRLGLMFIRHRGVTDLSVTNSSLLCRIDEENNSTHPSTNPSSRTLIDWIHERVSSHVFTSPTESRRPLATSTEWILTKAIQVVCSRLSWEDIYNEVISGCLWPLLNRLLSSASEEKENVLPFLFHCIGNVCKLFRSGNRVVYTTAATKLGDSTSLQREAEVCSNGAKELQKRIHLLLESDDTSVYCSSNHVKMSASFALQQLQKLVDTRTGCAG